MERLLSSTPPAGRARSFPVGSRLSRAAGPLALAAVVASAGVSPISAQSGAPGVPPDGRALFLDACAACHGADGRGLDRALVAFEEELPDFTDCSFASREPAADWVAVAHQGGPVRAFSPMMPSFGEALTLEELERVVDYVTSLCSDRAWPRGELNLPRALVIEKAYPEDEVVLETQGALEGAASFLHTFVYEKRFGPRSQIELAVPFGYRRAAGVGDAGASWSAGPGDVAIGVKHVLSHGLRSGRILSAVGEVKLPTGDEADGFGSGSTAFEGFLALGQILPSDAFLQAQAGAERSAAAGAGTELFWAALLGRSFAQGGWGRTWSPMVEVIGRREGDEGTLWELIPQLHVTLSTRQHVMVTLGPRIPVGSPERRAAFMVSFLWDWYDGGLLEGWR